MLSQRLSQIKESATLKLNAKVKQLKADGVDVINLTAGEPDFDVHADVKTAVIDAVNRGQSKYTPAPGIPQLREAVAKKTNSQQPGLKEPWKAANVIVTNGGKQALFNTFLAILNKGDEVIVTTPYWLSYPEMVKIAEGVPVEIKTEYEQGFKLTPALLESKITPKTKAVIFNSPSNPSGVMYSKEEYAALAKVLEMHPQVWVISDEIYDRIILDEQGEGRFCSFLDAAPQLQDRTVTVNGLSKSAAMTGWRVGWSVAQTGLTKGMLALQGQSTSGINALAQWAGLAALGLPDSPYISNAKTFRKRRDLLLAILGKCGKIKVCVPDGAFYAFVGVQDCLQKGEDAIGFAERLLEHAKVAAVPGTPFGEPTFVRLSFATDEKSLEEGCHRLVQFVEKQEASGN